MFEFSMSDLSEHHKFICKIFMTVLLSFVDLRKMVEACRNEEVQCCGTVNIYLS
jgi:hypothetical protein